MNFSKSIRHALVDAGMNPSELARQTKYSPQYIHNLLKGDKRWNDEAMQKVCNVLNLEMKIVSKGGGVKSDV